MTNTRSTLTPRPSTMTREAFIAAFGDVYEHSSWIADAAHAKGIGPDADTAAGLAAVLARVVDVAPPGRQLELLRAHPDLAGELARAGALADASASEQARAGLDRCAPEQFARFGELNDAYVEKFGFPFIIAVPGLDRDEILLRFEQRIGNTVESERAEALAQVHRIACMRLRRRVSPSAVKVLAEGSNYRAWRGANPR